MVKDTNQRVTITITKKQYKWLLDQSLKKEITISKFISWLLIAKCNEIYDYMRFNVNSMDELIEIAKANWIDK